MFNEICASCCLFRKSEGGVLNDFGSYKPVSPWHIDDLLGARLTMVPQKRLVAMKTLNIALYEVLAIAFYL